MSWSVKEAALPCCENIQFYFYFLNVALKIITGRGIMICWWFYHQCSTSFDGEGDSSVWCVTVNQCRLMGESFWPWFFMLLLLYLQVCLVEWDQTVYPILKWDWSVCLYVYAYGNTGKHVDTNYHNSGLMGTDYRHKFGQNCLAAVYM